MSYELLEINDFKNRMKSVTFWNRKIMKLNEEIENINYKLDGTSAVQFNFDNIKNESTLREKHMRRIALYDKQNELIKEVELYEKFFELLSKQFNRLDEEMQDIVFSIHVLDTKMEIIAKELFISTSTLRDRIDKSISELFI